MSKFVKHESPRPASIRISAIIGIIWTLVVGVLWLVFRDGGAGGGFSNFVGRFHVLTVHMPVGVLFLAAILEIASRFKIHQALRQAIPFVLWIAFLGGIASTLLGYLLMGSENTAGLAMTRHLWTGLAVVVFSLGALIFFLLGKQFVYICSLTASLIAVSAAGHYGGAMVHDSDYLTEFAPGPLKNWGGETPATKLENLTAEIEETPIAERKIYADFIAPILDGKCNSCHNEDKIKGKLRLDSHELIMAGAGDSDFPTVVPGKPDDSEMVVRVSLEKDDDEFMPPKGDALTKEESQLIKLWIKNGAKTDTTIAQLGEESGILETATVVAQQLIDGEAVEDTWQAVWDNLSGKEKQARLDEAMQQAAQFNFSLLPISAKDRRLRVNVINAAKEFGDEQLAALRPVAEQIIWLDLARSQITDEGMKTINQMRNLEQLHLENTNITETGVAQLAALTKLEYLNLYGTNVGDGIFEHFKDLSRLKKLYLWQTKVSGEKAKAFERSVNLEVNTGVDLKAAAIARQEKQEAAAPKPKLP